MIHNVNAGNHTAYENHHKSYAYGTVPERTFVHIGRPTLYFKDTDGLSN